MPWYSLTKEKKKILLSLTLLSFSSHIQSIRKSCQFYFQNWSIIWFLCPTSTPTTLVEPPASLAWMKWPPDSSPLVSHPPSNTHTLTRTHTQSRLHRAAREILLNWKQVVQVLCSETFRWLFTLLWIKSQAHTGACKALVTFLTSLSIPFFFLLRSCPRDYLVAPGSHYALVICYLLLNTFSLMSASITFFFFLKTYSNVSSSVRSSKKTPFLLPLPHPF